MNLGMLELIGGIALAVAVLHDVFDTVVVPGANRSILRIARRWLLLLLPLWKLLRHRGDISTTFAPLIFVVSFGAWMALLLLAFGMMVHALGSSFDPPQPSYSQAIYLAGSALVTVGLNDTEAMGNARWVVLAAGLCGLAVLTMTVTYLLEVQTSLAGRETGILKLRTSAGDPPSALELLEKFARIDNQAGLAEVIGDGRDWCARVQQSHFAHPSLIYFRWTSTGTGWTAALGALLDLALLIEHCLDIPELRGRAVLLREDGTRMAQEHVALLGLTVPPQPQDRTDVAGLRNRLRAAGYGLRDEAGFQSYLLARTKATALVNTLAEHLGRTGVPPLASLLTPSE
jgi:hypothetical protein